jgi:hypothetical protein
MDADTIDEVAFFDAIEFMIKNTKDNSLVCDLPIPTHHLLLDKINIYFLVLFAQQLPL